MQQHNAQQEWEVYKKKELDGLVPILTKLGYTLEEKQPHTSGERFLQQAVTVTHGRKLILLGKRVHDRKRVVIKATTDPQGAQELIHERACRTILREIKFAYHVFVAPEEILFKKISTYTISIQAFIDQEKTFLERPLEEQFTLALKAFKAQEGAHATTYAHQRLVKKYFGSIDAVQYVRTFKGFATSIMTSLPNYTHAHLLDEGYTQLKEGAETIEQYCGFLTHIDFVPHNFKVVGEQIYLLDHASLRFGNKYEGWARFLNFMALYNPELEDALLQYVRDNRTEEELRSLTLMRIYRLGEIIWYYTNTLNKISGNLNKLNKARVEFWSQVLQAIVTHTKIDPSTIDSYKKKRDQLRSKEENERQIGLH